MTKPLIIGVISDTHGLLRPEAVEALANVDHILHAGDVGDLGIIARLRSIAPVTAIRGNTDVSGACSNLPPTEAVELGGRFFYLVHAIEDLDIEPIAGGFDAVIYGHSHKPEIREIEGVLYLNPGSAGPRRFKLPTTVARLVIDDGAIQAEIVSLGSSA